MYENPDTHPKIVQNHRTERERVWGGSKLKFFCRRSFRSASTNCKGSSLIFSFKSVLWPLSLCALKNWNEKIRFFQKKNLLPTHTSIPSTQKFLNESVSGKSYEERHCWVITMLYCSQGFVVLWDATSLNFFLIYGRSSRYLNCARAKIYFLSVYYLQETNK